MAVGKLDFGFVIPSIHYLSLIQIWVEGAEGSARFPNVPNVFQLLWQDSEALSDQISGIFWVDPGVLTVFVTVK